MKKKLSALRIANLKPKEKPYYVSDELQIGLRVRVAPSGVKSWNVAYRLKGSERVRSTSLGQCDPNGHTGLSLAEARERTSDIIKAARQGRDLVGDEAAERKAAAERISVNELIGRYAKSIRSPHRKGGPLRTSDEIERRLRRAMAEYLDTPAVDLKRRDLRTLFDAVAERGHGREAEKRRQVTTAMFRWAVNQDYLDEAPTKGLASYGSGEPRDRVLTQEEIATLWNWLDAGAQGMPPSCIDVLKVQLCTGARCGEIAGMQVSELVEQDGHLIWVLPPERSKNKTERLTPLVGMARIIIESRLAEIAKGPLFPTAFANRALTASDVGHALVKRRKKMPLAHFTTHDLRRTVVSQMDELGIALDTIAAVVGHQRGSTNERTLVRHYARPVLTERKVQALTAWDYRLQEFISCYTSDHDDSKIVQLRQ